MFKAAKDYLVKKYNEIVIKKALKVISAQNRETAKIIKGIGTNPSGHHCSICGAPEGHAKGQGCNLVSTGYGTLCRPEIREAVRERHEKVLQQKLKGV